MNNKSIMTDFYELTMAQTYFDSGKKDEEEIGRASCRERV